MPASLPQPTNVVAYALDLFQHWFSVRGLLTNVLYVESPPASAVHMLGPWHGYALESGWISPLPNKWQHEWHDTWAYGLYNLIKEGALPESRDEDMGEEFSCPCVYCITCFKTCFL